MGLVLVRERFSSITAAVSIRSKPNSRFQTLSFSCISKRRICPRRCVAAQIVAFTSSDVFAKPRSLVVIFENQVKKRSGSRSPDLEPPTISSNPGSLGFPGCALLALLRPVPPTLALSSQRSRSVPRPCVLDVEFSHSPGAVRAGNVPALGSWVQTDQYCNPIPGSPLWVLALGTRSLLSCGRWFLTPHWRCPQSTLGRWCLWLLRPIGCQTQASRCRVVVLRPNPCSPSQISGDFKIPNFSQKHDNLQSLPSEAPKTID